MAVWLYAYGKNELSDDRDVDVCDLLNQVEIDELKILDSLVEIGKDGTSIAEHYIEHRKQIEERFAANTDEEYRAYLTSVNFPYMDRNKVVDYFISTGLEQERKEKKLFETTNDQFKKGMIKSEWEKVAEDTYCNRLCNFHIHGGLKVVLINDLIQVTGPFDIFSVYVRFLEVISTESRAYYHSMFSQICKVFKSEFILYTHEWAGLDDEEDEGFNFKKLKKQSDWTNTSSASIKNMDGFYFELL